MTTEQRQKIFNYFAEFGLQLMDSDFNEIENILSTPSNPSPLTAEEIGEMAINYASQFGNSKPEQFTPEQIHRLHGFDDGCMAVLKAFASSVQQTGYSREDVESELLGFQIFLAAKGKITDYGWDFEKMIKQYMKTKDSLTK